MKNKDNLDWKQQIIRDTIQVIDTRAKIGKGSEDLEDIYKAIDLAIAKTEEAVRKERDKLFWEAYRQNKRLIEIARQETAESIKAELTKLIYFDGSVSTLNESEWHKFWDKFLKGEQDGK